MNEQSPKSDEELQKAGPLEPEALPVAMEPEIGRRRAKAKFDILVGTAISLGLMFWTGRHNSSVLLIALFTVWVALPFVGMALICRKAKLWPAVRQKVTYNQIWLLSFGSALVYMFQTGAGNGTKPARVFLLVPFASLILMAVWLWMTRYFHAEPEGETTVLGLSGAEGQESERKAKAD